MLENELENIAWCLLWIKSWNPT